MQGTALRLQGGYAGSTVGLRPARASQNQAGRVLGSTIQCKESRIGKLPIPVPSGVKLTVDGQTISVKGPKGELQEKLPELLEITTLDDGSIRLFKREESRTANELHGLFRSLTNNMVVGTSQGFTKVLQLIGVGYRAAVSGSKLTVNLGFSHPVEFAVPEGLSVAVEKNTLITISGIDKSAVGDFAAKIRVKRPPEPYKGKGVHYQGEKIRRKEGKRGK